MNDEKQEEGDGEDDERSGSTKHHVLHTLDITCVCEGGGEGMGHMCVSLKLHDSW